MRTPQEPPASASGVHSLVELRAQLLQQAAAVAAKARSCRLRGDERMARRLDARARKLVAIARSVDVT